MICVVKNIKWVQWHKETAGRQLHQVRYQEGTTWKTDINWRLQWKQWNADKELGGRSSWDGKDLICPETIKASVESTKLRENRKYRILAKCLWDFWSMINCIPSFPLCFMEGSNIDSDCLVFFCVNDLCWLQYEHKWFVRQHWKT